jgi:hypothetical protein
MAGAGPKILYSEFNIEDYILLKSKQAKMRELPIQVQSLTYRTKCY